MMVRKQAQHIRKVNTKRGKRRVVINRDIPKRKVKKRMGFKEVWKSAKLSPHTASDSVDIRLDGYELTPVENAVSSVLTHMNKEDLMGDNAVTFSQAEKELLDHGLIDKSVIKSKEYKKLADNVIFANDFLTRTEVAKLSDEPLPVAPINKQGLINELMSVEQEIQDDIKYNKTPFPYDEVNKMLSKDNPNYYRVNLDDPESLKKLDKKLRDMHKK